MLGARMDISVLRSFLEVARRGSFAAVARDRNLTPSAISRMIQTLEDELGVRLIQRTTRRLSLTEAGRIYFERIEPLLDEIEAARLVVADSGTQPRGTLRITTSVSFGQKCVVPLLPRFTAAYPELGIDLLISDAMVDIIAEGIDVAIRLGRRSDPAFVAGTTLIASQLLATRYLVCASREYLDRRGMPQCPADLADHECLLLPLAGFRSSWMFRNGQGEQTEIAVKGRVTISAVAAIHQCALAGMGLALLPHWLVAGDLASGALVHILPEYQATATDFDRAVWILYPSRVYVPLKTQVFADFLRQELRSVVAAAR
jgi:DNA-binding transcriptional LysR family regulator